MIQAAPALNRSALLSSSDMPVTLMTRSTPGISQRDVGRLLQGLAGAAHRGAFGQLQRDQQIALVVDRDEGGGDARQAPEAERRRRSGR